MTRWQRFRKAMALVTAMLLVAGFVFYRAGFDQVFMSTTKSTFVFIPSGPISPATQAEASAEGSVVAAVNATTNE